VYSLVYAERKAAEIMDPEGPSYPRKLVDFFPDATGLSPRASHINSTLAIDSFPPLPLAASNVIAKANVSGSGVDHYLEPSPLKRRWSRDKRRWFRDKTTVVWESLAN
jgi:hypothetical protein